MKIQYIVSPTHPEYRNIPIRWDDQSISLLEYHLSKLNLDHVKYVYIDDIKNEDDLVSYYGVDIVKTLWMNFMTYMTYFTYR